MKQILLKLLLLITFLCSILIYSRPGAVQAQKIEPLNQLVQEFFIAETVYPQEKKELQFTLRPVYWNNEQTETVRIPLQIEYGFTNRFQVELSLPYNFNYPKYQQNNKGIGNTEVSFLYNLLGGNKPFALSLSFGVGLPTANKEKLTDEDGDEFEWEPAIIIAKQIGSAQIHAGLAGELINGKSALNYNIAAVLPVANWRCMLELNGTNNDRKMFYLTPGLVWKGLEDFELGAGFSKSITNNTDGWSVILMLTYELNLIKRTNPGFSRSG